MLGRQKRKVFAKDEEALAWLESSVGLLPRTVADWPMYGGDPSRTAIVDDGNPWLKQKYQVPALADAILRHCVEKTRRRHRDDGIAALPSLHPLVVGQTVIMRTATEMRGLDLDTGKIRWEAPMDDRLGSFVRLVDMKTKRQAADAIVRGLAGRLWEDLSFGTASSDGRLVFGLDDVPFDLEGDSQPMVVLPNGRRQVDPGVLKSYNTLSAYDLRTGKIRWEVGGPPGPGGDSLAGAFFLGPPLPLDDQLYVVADAGDQTRLLAIQAATGAIRKEWTLAVHEEQPRAFGFFVPSRQPETASRRWSAGPSYADGVLVACVPDNRYVGLDLMSGQVLWVFQDPRETVDRMNFRGRRLQRPNPADGPDRWCDPGATIADGRVLVCPRDSERLVCLRLADGSQVWSIPRGDGLYVGGVHKGKVIVAGHKSIRAISLADGRRAWEQGDVWLPASAPPLWPWLSRPKSLLCAAKRDGGAYGRGRDRCGRSGHRTHSFAEPWAGRSVRQSGQLPRRGPLADR